MQEVGEASENSAMTVGGAVVELRDLRRRLPLTTEFWLGTTFCDIPTHPNKVYFCCQLYATECG